LGFQAGRRHLSTTLRDIEADLRQEGLAAKFEVANKGKGRSSFIHSK
jgi:hypothetical protein